MPTDVIPAHSVAEAFLYVLVVPCEVCLHGARQPSVAGHGADGAVRVMAVCDNCGACDAYRVVANLDTTGVDPLSATTPLNATAEPSRLIDVVQWMTLHELLMETADATPDPVESRWRRHRARACIDEALRFYDPDSDVPPEAAFFTDASRNSYRRHPQHYARQRLLALRDKLPLIPAQGKDASNAPRAPQRRPWWRFWAR